MATTYSTNSDIIFSTGASVDEFFDNSLDAAAIEVAKDKVRERSFNKINLVLADKLPLPADLSVLPVLKDIEVDLCIAFLIRDGYVLQDPNTSDWRELYDRTLEELDDIKFDAQASTSIGNENVGDGVLEIIAVNRNWCRTEEFFISANNATQFSVSGSYSGYLNVATVDVQFPEKAWINSGLSGSPDYGYLTSSTSFERYPFTFIIHNGATPFEQGDNFVVNTFKSSWKHFAVGKIKLA